MLQFLEMLKKLGLLLIATAVSILPYCTPDKRNVSPTCPQHNQQNDGNLCPPKSSSDSCHNAPYHGGEKRERETYKQFSKHRSLNA